MLLSKKETFFLLFLFYNLFLNPLYGQITLGILSGIRDNASVSLLDHNKAVECIPIGVKPLEVLAKEAGEECTKSIDAYYRSHPHERFFAQEHLHLHQTYHYEKGNKGCVLYSNGAESYSEQLLSEGLAVVDEKFDEVEWNTKLRRANTRAKVRKVGIYETDAANKCIKGENPPPR